MAAEVTVFVVDDDEAMRRSLRFLIESVGLAVETYGSGEEFLERSDLTRTGCVVLDVRMSGMSGLDVQQELHRRRVATPVIVITGYGEVTTAVRAMRAGAVDFIEKPFHDQELIDKVQEAIGSDRKRRKRQERQEAARARLATLTPRERDVLDLIVQGKSNKMIAAALGIGEKTVEVHRGHLVHKLDVASLADLVRVTLLARGEPREG